MTEAILFALKYFGFIKDIVQEGIVIGPEIAKLVKDGYDIVSTVFDEKRPPSETEKATLGALEEYWRNRLQSDDDLTDK